MTDETPLPGSKIVTVDGQPALAVGSRRLNQQDIRKIASTRGITGVLFYTSVFEDVDLSTLDALGLKKLVFLHGNFGNKGLLQIERLRTLEFLKILGTHVSEEAVQQFQRKFPQIDVKYTR